MQLDAKHKRYLIIGGIGVAGAAVLYILLHQQSPSLPPGVVTDTPSLAETPTLGGVPSLNDNSPGYSGGNMPPVFPQPLPTEMALQNAPPAGSGKCCSPHNPCYGGSPLDMGSTYAGPDALGSLLNFYRDTNPNYIQLVAEQNQQYSAMFVQGSSYGAAPSLLGITG